MEIQNESTFETVNHKFSFYSYYYLQLSSLTLLGGSLIRGILHVSWISFAVLMMNRMLFTDKETSKSDGPHRNSTQC